MLKFRMFVADFLGLLAGYVEPTPVMHHEACLCDVCWLEFRDVHPEIYSD